MNNQLLTSKAVNRESGAAAETLLDLYTQTPGFSMVQTYAQQQQPHSDGAVNPVPR